MALLNTQFSRLKEDQGHLILHVEGSPFEMGFQHGSLLQEKISWNIERFLRQKQESLPPDSAEKTSEFLKSIPHIIPHIPLKYIEEMQGIAQGSHQTFEDILLLNLFPEMFHCCGITVSNAATEDGSLYHVRVLDYSVGKELQSSAILIYAKPKNGISFLNATYAGFIGSVTGMNEQKISIGEIGGKGYGNWNGIPMSFLLRLILEEAKNLEEAETILKKAKRTCEYYYIIGDGKINGSFACYATPSQIVFLSPGETYFIAPPQEIGKDLLFEKGSSNLEDSLNCSVPADTLLLTGLSYPARYPVLLKRIQETYGQLNAQILQKIIEKPVSLDSNLHNAIFHPKSLSLWLSHGAAQNSDHVKFAHFHWKELANLFN